MNSNSKLAKQYFGKIPLKFKILNYIRYPTEQIDQIHLTQKLRNYHFNN